MARGPRKGRTDAVDSDVIEHSTFVAILRWANKPTWLVWCVCLFLLDTLFRKYSPDACICVHEGLSTMFQQVESLELSHAQPSYSLFLWLLFLLFVIRVTMSVVSGT